MPSRGRPPVLDEMKKREILAIVSVGCSRRTAASYVGCAVSTIQNTADRDTDFAERLRHAENQHEFQCLQRIHQAAKKPQYWRAAAWVLERVFPQKYARRAPETITVDQIKEVLTRFADICTQEVPVAEHRKGVLKRIDALIRGLFRSIEASANSELPDLAEAHLSCAGPEDPSHE